MCFFLSLCKLNNVLPFLWSKFQPVYTSFLICKCVLHFSATVQRQTREMQVFQNKTAMSSVSGLSSEATDAALQGLLRTTDLKKEEKGGEELTGSFSVRSIFIRPQNIVSACEKRAENVSFRVVT